MLDTVVNGDSGKTFTADLSSGAIAAAVQNVVLYLQFLLEEYVDFCK